MTDTPDPDVPADDTDVPLDPDEAREQLANVRAILNARHTARAGQ